METVCSRCHAPLKVTQNGNGINGSIAYGICHKCAGLLQQGEKKSARDFLEQFAFPVLLMMGGEPRTHIANHHACDFLGKSLEAIEGKLGGDMIECVHARRAGGCGRHIHCKGCAVRKSVLYTFTTGKTLTHVPATLDLMPENSMVTIRFMISTEKVGDGVIVHLEKTAKATAKAA